MTARDIMITDVPVIHPDVPAPDAIRRLKENYGDSTYINAAPGMIVVDDAGNLKGILSPLSIIRALVEEAEDTSKPFDQSFFDSLCMKLTDRKVSDIMDWQAISVTPDATLFEIAELFVSHRFHRIPVVEGHRVVGIIYRSRVLFAMTSCFT
jgi:CBS domain-containing protein